MKQKPIYLDCHATTPIDPLVLEAMQPYFNDRFGNPASIHHIYGWEAEAAVEYARKQVAELIGASAEEIIFTSGATESNNLLLLGIARRLQKEEKHFISVKTEHSSILEPLQFLAEAGERVTLLDVDSRGHLDFDELNAAIKPYTSLLSVMTANHEIGVLAPLKKIGALSRAKNILFHTDATQSLGKIPIDVKRDFIDFLSCSAHKIYGPKGVGALYINQDSALKPLPLFYGGGHEKGYRPGTLNVAGIVGFGKACEIAKRTIENEQQKMLFLRNRFLQRLQELLPLGWKENGPLKHRLPNNLNLCFEGVAADRLLLELKKDVAFSLSSTCASQQKRSSSVLKAIGLSNTEIKSSVRIGLGRMNQVTDIDWAVEKIVAKVKKLKE